MHQPAAPPRRRQRIWYTGTPPGNGHLSLQSIVYGIQLCARWLHPDGANCGGCPMKRNSELFCTPDARRPARAVARPGRRSLLVVLLSMSALVIDIGVVYFSYQEARGRNRCGGVSGRGGHSPRHRNNHRVPVQRRSNAPARGQYLTPSEPEHYEGNLKLDLRPAERVPQIRAPPCATYSIAQGQRKRNPGDGDSDRADVLRQDIRCQINPASRQPRPQVQRAAGLPRIIS